MEATVNRLRATLTHKLETHLFSVRQDLVWVDGDGDAYTIPHGARVLVIQPDLEETDLVDDLLDNAEKSLHHAYSLVGWHEGFEPDTETVFDVRTNGRPRIIDNSIPF